MRLPLLVAAAIALTASPASAAPYTMSAGGSISRGFIATPTLNSVNASGSATVVLGAVYACGFTGTETGSLTESIGHWEGGCGPYRCTDWLITRVGSALHATCSVGQAGSVPLTFTCHWQPLDVNPVTHFTIQCGGVAA